MKDPRLISRRRFLGQASCAAVSTLPVLSTLL
ncbi:MAG: twin-arginine translocation signal domain-containing protein, partial [Burkholderiales bacterium]|nr:twin-arginine translocation signal domain-containing protein [Opitutaceae bacterium]